MNYKLTNCIPTLEAKDIQETISFYVKKLGFQLISVYPDREHPLWANVKRDNVEVIFKTQKKTSTIGLSGSLYFYPTDVQEAWEALKDIVAVERPIKVNEHGVREFSIRDCNGYMLYFGKVVHETTDNSVVFFFPEQCLCRH